MSELQTIEEIKGFLAKDDVKRILADNYISMIVRLHPKVPKSQIVEHLNLVQLSGANPYKKQVYFTSYFSKKLGHAVGSTVFSYRFFEDVANRTKDFKGCPCEITTDEYFDPEKGEAVKTLKATAIAYREGREPITFIAWYPEFVQRGYGNEPQSVWKDKPHIMLRKCAIAGALRSQFPETLGTFYLEDEMNEVNDNAEREALVENDITETENASVEYDAMIENAKTSKVKNPIMDAIRILANEITAGFTVDNKIKYLQDNIGVDSFGRLKALSVDELKTMLTKLESLKLNPVVMPETVVIDKNKKPSFKI